MEHTVTRLAALLPDESLGGFLIRLCEINGVSHPNILAERFHTSTDKLRWGKDAGTLRYLAGNRKLFDTAKRRPRKGVHAVFYGQKVDWKFIADDNVRRVCPDCLRSSRHLRHFWEISAFESCPLHGLELISECACGEPLSWEDATIDRPRTCACNSHALGRREALPTSFELWLAGRLGLIKPLRTDSWLDTGDLYSVTRFLHRLGREIAEGFQSKSPSDKGAFSIQERNAFSKAGYYALIGDGFEEIVCQLVARYRAENGDTPPDVPAHALGRFGERCMLENEEGVCEALIARIDLAVAAAYRKVANA